MQDTITRQAGGIGRWFPANPDELRAMVEQFIEDAPPCPAVTPVVGGIAPHAGYVYSGHVAGHTFRAFVESARVHGPPETVVVVGFNHRPSAPGVALLDGSGLATPLGVAALDEDAARVLAGSASCIYFDPTPHYGEHSAENQVPFLQVALPQTPLVLALMGDHDDVTVTALADAVVALASQRNIAVVASTDLLHDPNYERVCDTDRETLSLIGSLDERALLGRWSYAEQVCCGIGPVRVTMRYARARGCAAGTVLHYRNSGDEDPASRGNWVVGYGAAVFSLPA